MCDSTLPLIFISYSHKDEDWKDRLGTHLAVLENLGKVELWDDRDIETGQKWYDDIKDKLTRAKIAICVITENFLASEFCMKEEIPAFLTKAEAEGMVLGLLLVRPCAWTVVPWLKSRRDGRQMYPRDGKSIAELRGEVQRTRALAQFVEWIAEKVETLPKSAVPEPKATAFETMAALAHSARQEPTPSADPPARIDIARLPQTGEELFGRQEELALLDRAWDERKLNAVALVAWGGVGKSTLVNKWLEGLAAENWRGARRVYGWSFYSQGTGDRVTSAEEFINAALAWFGDTGDPARSPWTKGERLAELVRAERTLLVLDGMEPLQWGGAGDPGRIKDPALQMLVTGLARDNPGLLVITTREPVADLTDHPGTAESRNLEQISAAAGRALLRVRGVRGGDAELERLSAAFGNHALAVSLVAAWLQAVPGHPASAALDLPDLPEVPVAQGRHPRRVLAAFAARFGEGPEIELLRLLGLFDRPAGSGPIAALRAPPPIPGLTGHLAALSEVDWLRLIARLRRLALLAPAGHHDPEALDAHPLVRTHFAETLHRDHPEAWKAGHDRHNQYYKSSAGRDPMFMRRLSGARIRLRPRTPAAVRSLLRLPQPDLLMPTAGSAKPVAAYHDRAVMVVDLEPEDVELLKVEGAVFYPNHQRQPFEPEHDAGRDAEDPRSIADVLKQIGAPEAWNTTKGAGVTIAIIDTGVDHRLAEIGPSRRSTLDLPSVEYRGALWHDEEGHGSMCAAIAAGSRADGGRYDGVAPKATVLSARSTLNDADLVLVYSDLNRALDEKRIAGRLVINNSYGFTRCTPPEYDDPPDDLPLPQAIRMSVALGAVVVFAAGNNHGRHPDCPDLGCDHAASECGPSTIWAENSLDDVISVGAVDWNDSNRDPAHPHVLSSRGPGQWAQKHPKPDCCAPTYGEVIFGNGYQAMSWWGTSGAAPQVAGLAALLLSIDKGLSSKQIADIIRDSARPLNQPNRCLGHGVIDCQSAVALVRQCRS